MAHSDKRCASKAARQCDLPLATTGVVDMLITELAAFRFVNRQTKLFKLMAGYRSPKSRRQEKLSSTRIWLSGSRTGHIQASIKV